jgi:tetratricopeptide (TPR) repeat protein
MWPEAHALMGRIQYRKRDRSGARRSFERALELDPASLDALTGLVQLDVAAKQLDQARRRVDAAVAKTPANPELLLLAARTYTTAGDEARAESTLRQAIKADPSFLVAYNVLGQLYIKQSRLDAARQEYEALAMKRPNDVAARTMVGMILQVQNRPAEARTHYEKILELDQRAAVAANNLAYMHAEAGTNLDVALNLAQTAKAALPDDPDVNDTLGWIYYKRGLTSLALEPLQQSVDKDPSNAMYLYHLGLAYLKAGDRVKARSMLERALTLQLASAEAAEARKALASIAGT